MTNDSEHHFVNLFAFYVSFLVKSVDIFVHFLLDCFLVLLSSENSLCMLDMSPLSDK